MGGTLAFVASFLLASTFTSSPSSSSRTAHALRLPSIPSFFSTGLSERLDAPPTSSVYPNNNILAPPIPDRASWDPVVGKSKQSYAAAVNRRNRTSATSGLRPPTARKHWDRTSPLASPPPKQKREASSSGDISTLPDTWYISRAFQGQSFFDNWSFATYPDPTHGQVQYISEEWAMATNMTYVNSAGQAIMRVDNWSYLAPGQSRNSVRIESNDVFNEGLFILDIEAAPWGCGVWPAWWSVGPNWPAGGEIDILEGVHDNVHNQVTFHTEDNCNLVAPKASTAVAQNFTGGISTTDCYAYADSNSGCAVIDPSVASYGTEFNTLGGGVFAMMWLSDGIRVWFFHRSSIPQDIVDSSPKPSTWGTPTTYLGNGCDIPSHFSDHQLVFDITFCGDWAGTSYIDSGCPGTCSERVQEPGNFANASWTINYVHVFGSPSILGSGGATGSSTKRYSTSSLLAVAISIVITLVLGIINVL